MIKIGIVSSVGATGVSVTYPDTGKTTAELGVLAICGLKQELKKDDPVIVAHFSNDTASGVVLGKYYAADIPKAEVIVTDGTMTFKDQTGSISLSEIIAK